MLELRTYGFKINFSTPSAGHIWWEGQIIHYHMIHVRMSELCNMILNLVQEAYVALTRVLLCEDEGIPALPAIPWSEIADDPGRDDVDYYFLEDRRNGWAVAKKHWLLNRVGGSPILHQRWIEKDGFNKKTFRQWTILANALREKLLLIIHLSSMPARGTELIGLRYQNTANGGLRNIVILDGMVTTITTYHKGYRHSGDVKLIYRFLPQEVGEIVIWYLWLVLPFWQAVQASQSLDDQGSPFL